MVANMLSEAAEIIEIGLAKKLLALDKAAKLFEGLDKDQASSVLETVNIAAAAQVRNDVCTHKQSYATRGPGCVKPEIRHVLVCIRCTESTCQESKH